MICDMAHSMNDSYPMGQSEYGSFLLQTFHFDCPAYAFGMGFGHRLAAIRKDRKMTQADLGVGLGTDGADVGKQVVYGWEKEQHYPRVDQLILICQKLNISADYLLFGDITPRHSQRVSEAEQAISRLTDQERQDLIAVLSKPGVPDHVVEQRIPITRPKAKEVK